MKIGPNQIKYTTDKTSFMQDPAYTHFFVYFAQTIRKSDLIEVRKTLKANNVKLIKYPKQGCALSILNILPTNDAVMLTYEDPTTSIYIGGHQHQYYISGDIPGIRKEDILYKIRSLYTKPLTLAYSFSPGNAFLTPERHNSNRFFPYDDIWYPPWFDKIYKYFDELPYLEGPQTNL